MLEIVFGHSAAGAMKVAQHYGAGEQADRERESARPMSGHTEDVLCFSLGLSMGDISGDCLSSKRLESLEPVLKHFPEDREEARKALREAQWNFRELLRRGEAGETLRIWYSGEPEEACGLCWLLAELKERMDPMPPVLTVLLPPFVRMGETLRRDLSWGEVSPRQIRRLLPLAEEAFPAFLTAAAMKWRELQEENCPLRAVVNGGLHGVPADFYDVFIRRELPEMAEAFQEAALIGRIMGKYQLKLGDLWLAYRIEEMVRAGELAADPASTEETPYRRQLRRVR